MNGQENSLEVRTQKVLLDTHYLRSWNEHIDELQRLAFHTTPEERERLKKIIEQLKELAAKCAERQLQKEKEKGESK
jgi:L-2-hydroxyglutarate oxidase LhgO